MAPLTQEGIRPSSGSVTGDSVSGTFLNPTGEGAASSTFRLGLERAGVIIMRRLSYYY